MKYRSRLFFVIFSFRETEIRGFSMFTNPGKRYFDNDFLNIPDKSGIKCLLVFCFKTKTSEHIFSTEEELQYPLFLYKI